MNTIVAYRVEDDDGCVVDETFMWIVAIAAYRETERIWHTNPRMFVITENGNGEWEPVTVLDDGTLVYT